MLHLFLEEHSMTLFLRGAIKRIRPNAIEGLDYTFNAYNGKRDLMYNCPKQVIGILRSQKNKVIILVDQDDDDCRILKEELRDSLKKGSQERYRVRIVCRELESWYIGDWLGLKGLYPALTTLKHADLIAPDSIIKPSQILRKMDSSFKKTEAARRCGSSLLIDSQNKSYSWQMARNAIEEMLL
ncbi:MAG: DUF4276 family protein [Thalassospira sp.]|jgi:hypothetical protein|nr:DUF4276 family protein [Thalassospira sp.]